MDHIDGADYGTEVNTGDIYSGALVGEELAIPDAAAQEAAMAAYEALMNTFVARYGPDAYPDWYGGAYVLGSALVVCVVENSPGTEDGSKELYLSIIDLAGGSSAVGFSDCKYSLNTLRELQREVEALPELRGVSSWGCGVSEAMNRVVLDVSAADDALLAALARLDPDDDAVRVQVSEGGFGTGEE